MNNIIEFMIELCKNFGNFIRQVRGAGYGISIYSRTTGILPVDYCKNICICRYGSFFEQCKQVLPRVVITWVDTQLSELSKLSAVKLCAFYCI